MATLEEVKEEIGQLRLEQGDNLTRLETEMKGEIGQLRLEHGDTLTRLETEIGQQRLEHGNKLTQLETEIGQLRLEHGDKLTRLETEIGQQRLEHGTQLTRLETLVEPMPEQLKKIEEGLRALERSHAEYKGIVVGARWIIGIGLAVLAACGGIAGAVVSHVLK